MWITHPVTTVSTQPMSDLPLPPDLWGTAQGRQESQAAAQTVSPLQVRGTNVDFSQLLILQNSLITWHLQNSLCLYQSS